MQYRAGELSPHERFKMPAAFVVPRPIVWVTTIGATGVVNATRFSFFNVVRRPAAMCVCCESASGRRTKDTFANIRRSNEFVINVVDEPPARAMTLALYLDDLTVGVKFGSGTKFVDEDEVRAFAKLYDPQPFHLDHGAAKNSVFGRLAASGWHTGAMTMRLLVESDFRIAGGIVGTGFDEFHWMRPVYPGDTLHLDIEVTEVRPSRSKPKQGVAKVRITTLNQASEVVQVLLASLVIPRR